MEHVRRRPSRDQNYKGPRRCIMYESWMTMLESDRGNVKECAISHTRAARTGANEAVKQQFHKFESLEDAKYAVLTKRFLSSSIVTYCNTTYRRTKYPILYTYRYGILTPTF